MEFTGSQLAISRSFYPQTGNMGFVVSPVLDNSSGAYYFGVTGAQGSIEFSLESGKVWYGQRALHSYLSYQPFVLSVQLASGSINLTKDNEPLVYGLPKITGVYDTFYFRRATASLGASFSLEISGDNVPSYSISTLGYLYASGQMAVTGRFVNQGAYPITVFSSEILASALYDFGQLAGVVAAGGTGTFAYTGDYSTIDFSAPILTTFHTNFGDVSSLFSIIDSQTLDRFVVLNSLSDFSFSNLGVVNRDVNYLNYSGGFVTNAFDTHLSFALSYIAGDQLFTGAYELLTGLDSSSLVSLRRPANSGPSIMSGAGIFAPNSSVTFQINHNVSGSNFDIAYLVISGAEVSNPITALITGINA